MSGQMLNNDLVFLCHILAKHFKLIWVHEPDLFKNLNWERSSWNYPGKKKPQVAHHFLTVWGEKGKGKVVVKQSRGRISWEQAQDAPKEKSPRASKEVNNYH